jgi:hypothetical protein
MILEDPGFKLRIFEKGELLSEIDRPLNKEGQNKTSEGEEEEDDFPQIFQFRVEEVKMFLRVVHFVTSQIIWEDRPIGELAPLEYLLGLQYLEWYENLGVTSTLVNKENQKTYEFWNFLLSKRGISTREQESHSEILVLREEINGSKQTYGHLTFRNYRSELQRNTFLEYIKNQVISRREIQRKHLYHPSHFKRSSDHSSSNSRTKSRGESPIPKVRNFEPMELQELLELSTHERKIHPLMGGIGLVSS